MNQTVLESRHVDKYDWTDCENLYDLFLMVFGYSDCIVCAFVPSAINLSDLESQACFHSLLYVTLRPT